MISPELLALLRCPATMQTLAPAPAELLQRLGLEGGLLRADGKVVYPIRNGIPVMLIDEAIPLGESAP